MAHLEVSDARGQRRVDLTGERLTIGRAPENDLSLAERRASRRHCELRRRDGRWVLADLGSANGTVVGGDRVKEAQLADGDVIEIGDAKLIFAADGAAPGVAPPIPAADDPGARRPATDSAPAPDPIRGRTESEPVPPACAGEVDLSPPPFDPAALADGEFAGTMVEDENRVHLACTAGGLKGREFDLTHIDTLTMGRKKDHPVVLLDQRASGTHCRFRREPRDHRFFLTDLGSTNGTLVNGARLEAERELELADGDEVAIGDLVFVFHHPRQAEALHARFHEKKAEKQRQARLRTEEAKEERSKVLFLVGGVVALGVAAVAGWLIWRGFSEQQDAQRQADARPPAVVEEPGNLLPRAGFSFETPWTGVLPEGWEGALVENIDGARLESIAADAGEAAASGTRFARFRADRVRPESRVVLRLGAAVPVTAGTSYLGRVQLRGAPAPALAGLQLTFAGERGALGSAHRFAALTTDWQEVPVLARAPAGARSVSVGLVFAGRLGPVDVDHLVLSADRGGADLEPAVLRLTDPHEDGGGDWVLTVDQQGGFALAHDETPLVSRARWEYLTESRQVVPAFEFAQFQALKPSPREFLLSGEAFDLWLGQWYPVKLVFRAEAGRLRCELSTSAARLPPSGTEFALVAALAPEAVAGGLSVRTEEALDAPHEFSGPMDRLVDRVRELAFRDARGRPLVLAHEAPSPAGVIARAGGPQLELAWPDGSQHETLLFTAVSPVVASRAEERLEDAARREGNFEDGAAMARYESVWTTWPDHRRAARQAHERYDLLHTRGTQRLTELKTAYHDSLTRRDEALRLAALTLAENLERRYAGTAIADEARTVREALAAEGGE